MKKIKFWIFPMLLAGFFFTACDKQDGNDDEPTNEDNLLITQSLFNSSSLISFETITSTLEDGTSAECFRITFASNPVANGPFCPETINDVAGMGFYDGATNPGLRVFAADLLNDIEADGYNMVNSDGSVNVDRFTGVTDPSKSYCLEAAPNNDLELTFIIPAVPKLANTNNVIGEVEFIGITLDGVPINGESPFCHKRPSYGWPWWRWIRN